jgi:hypothetical protein
MTTTCEHIGTLLMRVQAAFLDTPSLEMTMGHACRRFDTDTRTTAAILGALVEARVLAKSSDGTYMRFFPTVAGGSRAAARYAAIDSTAGPTESVARSAA